MPPQGNGMAMWGRLDADDDAQQSSYYSVVVKWYHFCLPSRRCEFDSRLRGSQEARSQDHLTG